MRRFILLAVAIGVVAAGILCVFWPQEPVYRGHLLSYWLQGYSPGPYVPVVSVADADAALNAAGTNAIPTLLRMLAAKDSGLERKLLALSLKQHFFKLHLNSALHQNAAAVTAFNKLGVETRRRVPVAAWISIYNRNPSALSWSFVSGVLGDLGPEAKSAVPSLLRVAANTNMSPVLRANAFTTLERIHAPAELVVPVLAQAVHDPNSMVREAAIDYLGPFGADAKPAVAALVELLSNPDANLRKLALDALKQIAPDMAAKALGEDVGDSK